jgi:beta-lactamase superfamily II metal-dependent hydrolase
MSVLSIHAYNVLFGDALLVSIPDCHPQNGEETMRHILIDVGNVLHGPGSADDVFIPIVKDIRSRLAGRPIDLYVMTHEHLDHVQGLFYAANQGLELEVDYTWLSASSEPDYYECHPESKRKRLMLAQAYSALESRLKVDPMVNTPWMASLMLNNNPRQTNPCVDYLRKLGRKANWYVHREIDLCVGIHHPFREAKLKILAPEEDTAIYYGPIRPFPGSTTSGKIVEPQPPPLVSPKGVDPNAFRKLLNSWFSGISGNVLAIDRATNNTSVVFSVEWRGWRLLFSGDAEQKSWQIMASSGLLEPVHFLKVGHHGSLNATPPDPILEQILPNINPNDKKRTALISTLAGTYNGVPHGPTIERLKTRCDQVLKTDFVKPGDSVKITFS